MKKSPIQNLVMLSLITLYIVGSGFVVLYGAQFYSAMVKESTLSLNNHSALLYFNNRLKQHDDQGKITLKTEQGITALVLDQDGYFTLVYEQDGYLVEQSSESDAINPLEAQKVLQLSGLSYTFEDHGLTIAFTDPSGKPIHLHYTLIYLEPAS